MPPEQPQFTPKSRSKTALMLVTLVLVVLIIFGGWNYFQTYFKEAKTDNGERQPVVHFIDHDLGLENDDLTKADLQGHLVISGVKKNENAIQTYFLDLANEAADLLKPIDTLPFTGFVSFDDQAEPRSVFFRTISQSSSAEFVKQRVHQFDLINKTLTFFKGIDGVDPRNYEWSETNQLLAYNQLKQITDASSMEFVTIDNYEIVIYSPEENKIVRTIDGAMQPFWTPDGEHLVFLRDDGVYVLDLGSGAETPLNVFFLDADMVNRKPTLDATTMIELSADGKTLIWSNGIYGKLYIYDLTLEPTPTVTLRGKIIDTDETQYYWPTISPDGRFYAVQAIDHHTDPLKRTNPRLEIRSINSRTVLVSYPLDDFDFNALFIDDWTAVLPEFY